MSNNAVSTTSTWAGGKSPFRISYGKLMMWFFLLSDAFTFSSLLVGYATVRFAFPQADEVQMAELRDNMPFGTDVHEMYHTNPEGFVGAMKDQKIFTETQWPAPELVFNHFPGHHLHWPLMFVSLMTFILIMSSVTMVLAVEAGQRMERKKVEIFMLLTIVGGLMFLGCQAWEWTKFIGEGARLDENPFGPVTFAALFFLVTGFHGFHVLSGVVINFVIYVNVLKGTYEERGHYEMVEKVGLYWHFVDLVWVFVFTFFYLI
ncbi:MAG: cytochrome c oxidase subunit 3 [Bacteroidia bacterium]|jgi:cytochrome c oxidase subunit 3